MDAYSSGEELLVKTRKPYTITKQRERWTEEEHNKFLEALKLYGRAWQRIEEHIGTKTAVQIRSHAQKFFSKLEKEALVKGVPVRQATDIEIPPPRPKRKPSNPYPRKTGAVCSSNIQVRPKDGKHMPPCSSHCTEEGINLEKEPTHEKHVCDDGEKIREGTCEGDKCSEAVTSLGVTRERPDKPDSIQITQYDTQNEMHAAKNFPRHARVQILDGSPGTCSQGLSSDVSYQEPKPQTEFAGHPASSPINQQMYPTFHPSYNPFPNNHGDYSSFLQMSSTFSSLILSALLQNPAAYAAANSAASLWPSPIMENSVNSPEVNNAGFGPGPSMAAIAAATVAAATAWWAAHGLLPLTAPFPAGFPSFANVGQTSVANEEKEENFKIPGSQVQQPEQEHSKSSETSSSNSGNSGEAMDVGATANDAVEVPVTSEQKDTNEVTKKQVDRSSCGSNTPSGSDAETDVLGKDDKGNEESKEPDENRRIRFFGNTNKEVSEEGRLAFKALFSKGRLPQSFSRPQHGVEGLTQNSEQRIEETPQLDLNSIPWQTASGDQSQGKIGSLCLGNNSTKEGPLTIGLLKAKTSNGTGFKPYKRCSVEARESGMTNSGNQEQGNCSKRVRLEGAASI